MKEQTALEVTGTPQQFITQAINQGLSVDHLEKLMALQERWQANQAKISFLDAINLFQNLCPKLEKCKKVEFGNTSYKYAPLGEISATIKDAMKQSGLSYRWEFDDKTEFIHCTCIVSHLNGHSESSTMSAKKDDSGKKNEIQSRGSTMTYLQRYTLIAALGITTADEDNDAQTSSQRNEPEQRYNTNTGEIHPQPETVTKNGKDVSFKVFDPKVEQITFGKFKGQEWITLEKWYLDYCVREGSPENKTKAKATLKYLEGGQSQQPFIDDLVDVFDKKAEQPKTLKINDTEKETKALIAIGKATSESKLESVVRAAAGYFDAGELTEETHNKILEMVETRRKTIGGKK